MGVFGIIQKIIDILFQNTEISQKSEFSNIFDQILKEILSEINNGKENLADIIKKKFQIQDPDFDQKLKEILESLEREQKQSPQVNQLIFNTWNSVHNVENPQKQQSGEIEVERSLQKENFEIKENYGIKAIKFEEIDKSVKQAELKLIADSQEFTDESPEISKIAEKKMEQPEELLEDMKAKNPDKDLESKDNSRDFESKDNSKDLANKDNLENKTVSQNDNKNGKDLTGKQVFEEKKGKQVFEEKKDLSGKIVDANAKDNTKNSAVKFTEPQFKDDPKNFSSEIKTNSDSKPSYETSDKLSDDYYKQDNYKQNKVVESFKEVRSGDKLESEKFFLQEASRQSENVEIKEQVQRTPNTVEFLKSESLNKVSGQNNEVHSTVLKDEKIERVKELLLDSLKISLNSQQRRAVVDTNLGGVRISFEIHVDFSNRVYVSITTPDSGLRQDLSNSYDDFRRFMQENNFVLAKFDLNSGDQNNNARDNHIFKFLGTYSNHYEGYEEKISYGTSFANVKGRINFVA